MSNTMAMHMRYNSWYFSLPSSANQQRETTKFRVAWRTRITKANILNVYFKFITGFQIKFLASFDGEKQNK